jgi:type I restriction enzyme S subunit
MDVLLSIKPKYAEAILNGVKKYEFRRTIFRRSVERVFIYSNSHVRKIVGLFEVEEILEGTPHEIWNSCHRYGGISKKDFYTYFEGSRRAFAIKIKNVFRFSEPIDPYFAVKNFTPPQSFYYIKFKIPEKWEENARSDLEKY